MTAGYSIHFGLNRFDPAAYGGQDLTLRACEADALAMADLAQNLGYRHRVVMLSEDATRRNILDEMIRISGLAKAGDAVLITASTHGALIPDADRDETEQPELGRDTAVLAHDGMIPDDKIWQALSWFRPGVRIALVFDLCHSADAARLFCEELAVPRDLMRAAPWRAVEAAAKDAEFQAMRGERPDAIDAEAILLAACRKDQYALDGQRNGAFTAALLQAHPKAVDWAHLCRRIRRLVPRTQTPVLTPYQASDHFLSSKPMALPEVWPAPVRTAI